MPKSAKSGKKEVKTSTRKEEANVVAENKTKGTNSSENKTKTKSVTTNAKSKNNNKATKIIEQKAETIDKVGEKTEKKSSSARKAENKTENKGSASNKTTTKTSKNIKKTTTTSKTSAKKNGKTEEVIQKKDNKIEEATTTKKNKTGKKSSNKKAELQEEVVREVIDTDKSKKDLNNKDEKQKGKKDKKSLEKNKKEIDNTEKQKEDKEENKNAVVEKEHDKLIKWEEIKNIFKKKKAIPKEELKKINKPVFINIVVAIGILVYFIFIILGFFNIERQAYQTDLKVFALCILLLGIILLEKAYKDDNGRIAVFGIEIIILAIINVGLIYVNLMLSSQYINIVTITSYVVTIYYVLKSIIIYIKGKNKYFVDNMKEIMNTDE